MSWDAEESRSSWQDMAPGTFGYLHGWLFLAGFWKQGHGLCPPIIDGTKSATAAYGIHIAHDHTASSGLFRLSSLERGTRATLKNRPSHIPVPTPLLTQAVGPLPQAPHWGYWLLRHDPRYSAGCQAATGALQSLTSQPDSLPANDLSWKGIFNRVPNDDYDDDDDDDDDDDCAALEHQCDPRAKESRSRSWGFGDSEGGWDEES
ncbi:hypothetical protein I7I51_07406 [Histoplasma capsulatum]|uniref:Uncharacterized protein n=1 Tax=Ajellomyces capsulatus TaxID=5037 RepID=A0A8A1M1B7_AJECA|nr:hypothetical protein I7I51_07406 [Histoplasma capsulatum]